MADKGIGIVAATSGFTDKMDTKTVTNGIGETVQRNLVALAEDLTTPLANPLPVQLGDGTHSQTVKAASTEAAFTDVAAVATLRPSENHVGEVGAPCATPSSNFTRPANTTAYASGQLVANTVTAGSVVPLSWTAARVAAGSFMIRRAKLKKSGTTITNATFRLHFFESAPGLTNGDGGTLATNENGYLGAIDLDMTGANGHVWLDSATVIGVPNVGSEMNAKLASGQTIYGLLEARGAYVPVSGETLTVTLELLQN
jgi:hypothetical protein